MDEVTIFVEGPSDQVFIRDVIRFHFEKELKLNSDIKSFQGKDKWANTKREFIKSTREGKTNLLIFDADNDPKNRRAELEEKKEELGLAFELFLFPNDEDPGELEDLLIQTCTEISIPIFECFETYKDCIHQLNEDYTKPDLKTKIYAYAEILTGQGKEKERDYLNNDIWNMESTSLEPLLNFLKEHLQNDA